MAILKRSYDWKEEKDILSQTLGSDSGLQHASCNPPQHSPCRECNWYSICRAEESWPTATPDCFSSLLSAGSLILVICLQDKLLAIQVLLELLYSQDYRQAFLLNSGIPLFTLGELLAGIPFEEWISWTYLAVSGLAVTLAFTSLWIAPFLPLTSQWTVSAPHQPVYQWTASAPHQPLYQWTASAPHQRHLPCAPSWTCPLTNVPRRT